MPVDPLIDALLRRLDERRRARAVNPSDGSDDGARAAALWVADEQVRTDADLHGLAVVSNRCDVARRLAERGALTELSDFEFSHWPAGSLERIAYRVSKEKAVVHHVINRALERLTAGGELLLAGSKQEGIRTYIAKAAQRAGGPSDVERLPAGGWLAVITRAQQLGPPLDDQAYAHWHRIAVSEDEAAFELATKPGVFGWRKVDAGSALLAAALDRSWPMPPDRVLDLGCGYGYLAVMAARAWPSATIVATDNNVAAVAAAQRNLAAFGPRASATIADCADAIEARPFDAVLCNPPFHQGFDLPVDITSRFLEAAATRLAPGGTALFVVNAFIGLERRAHAWFGECRVVDATPAFKVVALTRPRR